MNRPVRRVALAVMVMVVVLLANSTYIQVVKAGDYRDDPRNQRVQIDEYSRQRGQITAGGQVLAQSVSTNDRLKYLRQYPSGPAFSPITGFFSTVYGSSGLEKATDGVLNGTDDRLFVRRVSDLITGRDPAGGNVTTTINPAVQQKAFDEMSSKNFEGAVVALEPQTGDILAMASTPSYDPNPLASHDAAAQQKAWKGFNNADPEVLTNRAISQIYPPGSTFKLVDTAAALQNGFTPDSQLTAAPNLTLADSTTTLENYDGTPCGTGATASLRDALARSCNTAFAQLGQQLGADKIRAQAESFGIGRSDLQIPMGVQASSLGPMSDVPSTQQSAIGQRDVRLTPLQNAMIVASIANGGQTIAPHLVREIQSPQLDVVDTTEPDRMSPVHAGERRVHGDRPDDRLGEPHPGRREDHRGPDRVQDRYRRARHGPEEHPAARLVRRVRAGRGPEGRRLRARGERRQPRAGGDRRLGRGAGRPGGHRRGAARRPVTPRRALPTIRRRPAPGGWWRMSALGTGQLISDRYRLDRRIAVGGMGEVWEAQDTRLGRSVAVKVLKADLSDDPEFLHRFRIEARTVASLDHTGIASVYDYGEDDGPAGGGRTAYLVMELVRGEPLSTRIARGPMPVHEALDVLEQAARALHAAHECGFVHRDVKPGNILLRTDGVVKLTDFGIAKAADAVPVTRSGMVMGTAHYIAPEQASGDEAGPAGDVYSLGIVGYECLAGHRPFRADSAVAVAMMQVRDDPPPLPADIPERVRGLIYSVLVKDPEQRYSDGAEFADAVAAVRRGWPAPAAGAGAGSGHPVAATVPAAPPGTAALDPATRHRGARPVRRRAPGRPVPRPGRRRRRASTPPPGRDGPLSRPPARPGEPAPGRAAVPRPWLGAHVDPAGRGPTVAGARRP